MYFLIDLLLLLMGSMYLVPCNIFADKELIKTALVNYCTI